MTHQTRVVATPDQPCPCTIHCTCEWQRPVREYEDAQLLADRHTDLMNLHEQGQLQ
jgi:hypothetical protein